MTDRPIIAQNFGGVRTFELTKEGLDALYSEKTAIV